MDDWRDEFVLARSARAIGRHSDLVAAVRRGDLVPVIRGAYRRADAVAEARRTSHPADDAFLARVRATQLLADRPLVFSGFAAASVWRLPIIGSWPPRVEVATDPAAGGRSNASIKRSYLGGAAQWIERDGLRVTSLARTVVDVGRTGTFGQGVAMADAGLHGLEARRGKPGRDPVDAEELRNELLALSGAAGVRRCRAVLDFADGASGSPGESLSRVGIHLLGLPAPELQVAFSDSRGLIGVVDFWWPRFNLIGEFDGNGKYLRDEFANGRTTAQIVVDERNREKRLLALGHSVTRWDWPVAKSLPLLRSHLAEAGLR